LGLTLIFALATLWADPAELNAGVTSETRAGVSPLLGSQEPQAFTATLVTPMLDGELKEPGGGLRLAYYPRFVWQTPNALDRTVRPLILHQVSLAAAIRPNEATHFSLRAYGSYGEPDYSILPQLVGSAPGSTVPIGPVQSAVPQIQTILTASATALLEGDVSRRLSLTLGGGVSHFRPIGAPPAPSPVAGMAAAPSFLIEQTTASVSPGFFERLAPSDDLGLVVNASYATYSDGVDVGLVGPSAFWRERRAGRYELRLELGATIAHDLGAVSAVPGGTVVSPTGAVDGAFHVVGQDESGLLARFRAGVDEFVDPILSQVYPRAFVSAQLAFVVAPNWWAGVQGDFTTSLISPSMATMNLDETALSVVVPVRHRFGPNVIVELGGRWGERAPAITSSDFGFRERQLWAYLAITADTRERSAFSWR
jgi:hypothetical protein